MAKKMFENVLQSNETILWAGGTNKKAYFLKTMFKEGLLMLFGSVFLTSFVGVPMGVGVTNPGDDPTLFLKFILLVFLIIFGTSILCLIIKNLLSAKNTYFAITSKRIIKRSGIFNSKYIYYSLKNVGTVEIIGSIFDSKGNDGSATLLITTKDFHNNAGGNTGPLRLDIICLNNAYKAYNLLTEQIDGNNEVLRIKTEK